MTMTLVLVLVPDNEKRIATAALEAGLTHLVFEETIPEAMRALGRFEAYTLEGDALRREGKTVGTRIEIESKADEERAATLARREGLVIVAARDWKVIPLENLIAHFQHRPARLLAEVETAAEAQLFLETLEVGTDGVLLRARSPDELRNLRRILDSKSVPLVNLEEATIRAVRAAGVGDRICIDTTSILAPSEGMLVGSSATALFLLASEATESEYVASRPFRVNAGAVHAYVLLPGGKTKYLAELRSGDEVLAVDARGKARVVVVGRCKLERRPMILVEATLKDRPIATIVQNAETIRLATPDGVKSVSALAPGDRVLVRTEEGGRHFGMAVSETMVER